MMVGLAETTHRDRHEGEVPEAAPAKHPLIPPSPYPRSETNHAAPGTSLKGLLSPSRQRVFHLLQRQLLLQLAADARGPDVDPRRRPPHVATPHGILARWLTADPKRLRGSCLLKGLHGRLLEGGAPTTHPSEIGGVSISSVGSPPPSRPSPAATQQHKGTAFEEQLLQGWWEAAAAAAAAGNTPQKEGGIPFLREKGESGGEREGGRNTAAEDAHQAEASSSQQGKVLPASTSGKVAVGLGAARGNRARLCVICCSPLESSGSGFLCTPCLLRLRSTSTLTASFSAAGEAAPVLETALSGAPADKAAAAKEEQLCSETQLTASQRMGKKRCFRRAASTGQQAQLHQQQQQQQPLQQEQQPVQREAQQGGRLSSAAGFVGEDDGPQEDASWRARATAAAAATEEESSWWRVPESSGESAVIPSLLLPLLPSIFSLHARPWPPPPTKRRRIVSRRRRGLCMGPSLTEGPSWEDVVRGEKEAGPPFQPASPEGRQLAALGQQRDDAAADAAAAAAAAGGASIVAAGAAVVAARGSDAAPAATAAGAPAREGGGEPWLAAASAAASTRPSPANKGGKQAADAPDEERRARCCTPSSSTSCLDPSFECPATALTKAKKLGSPPCPACCCLGATDPKAKGESRLCCVGFASPLSCPQEALLPRRRRARLSDPAGTKSGATAVVGTAAGADSGAAAAGLDIAAAAAAAAATFKAEGQQHEQHTPPSRFRRRSCGADVSRHSAAPEAADVASGAASSAAAAEAAINSVVAAAEASNAEFIASSSCGSTHSSEGDLRNPPVPVLPQHGSPSAAVGASASEAAPGGGAAGAAINAVASVASGGRSAAEEMESPSQQHLELHSPALSVSCVDTPHAPSPLPPPSSPSSSSSSGFAVGKAVASSGASGRQGGSPGGGGLARISQGLMVGPSSLGRGSGLGIYSCRSFSRRAVVCEYSGVLIDRGTALLLRRMRCATHVINVQMQHLYLLGFHTPCPLLGGGAFVNDGRWRSGGREGPGVSVRFRVTFDRHRAAQRVMVVAARDIEKGEELLTSYDNDYWRLMAQQGPPYAPPTPRGR